MEISDVYLGVNVGFWFQMENRIYAAWAFSEFHRLLFRSLILLDESQGRVLKEWYWNYSHCLEIILSNSSLPTRDSADETLPLSAAEWFAKQMSVLNKGTLLAHQENAMKELFSIIRDRESMNSPSV
jgi:hypothetical protein